jgi:hypothetical protein
MGKVDRPPQNPIPPLPWNLAGGFLDSMLSAMSLRAFLPLVLAVLLVPSCASIGGLFGSRGKEDKEEQPFGPTGIPPELRGGSVEGTPVAAGGNRATATLQVTPESEIMWTDPDNPEGSVAELAPLMSAPKKGPWEESESIAKTRAAREGKSLLIWFTDSKNSPGCKRIATELFADHAFNEWAREKFVRLKVDTVVRPTNPDLSIGDALDKEVRMKGYVADLKKRYKVLGHPTFLILSSGGDVVATYKGYRAGQADYTWGLFRQGESIAAKTNSEWRAGLIKKGYREWQDRKGNKVFAKLTNYSKGQLYFVEPDGKRSRTNEARLSDSDQAWIKQQKAARGIE